MTNTNLQIFPYIDLKNQEPQVGDVIAEIGTITRNDRNRCTSNTEEGAGNSKTLDQASTWLRNHLVSLFPQEEIESTFRNQIALSSWFLSTIYGTPKRASGFYGTVENTQLILAPTDYELIEEDQYSIHKDCGITVGVKGELKSNTKGSYGEAILLATYHFRDQVPLPHGHKSCAYVALKHYRGSFKETDTYLHKLLVESRQNAHRRNQIFLSLVNRKYPKPF